MKKGVNEILEDEGYSNAGKRIWIAFFILFIAIIIFIIYIFMNYSKQCNDENCFFNSLTTCKKVYFIKEDLDASWYYRVIKSGKTSCEVQVKLLKLKKGTIENEILEGKEMICTVLKGIKDYPEARMSDCSGVLREQMQEIIIQRMHNYLLKNIGQINNEFKKV